MLVALAVATLPRRVEAIVVATGLQEYKAVADIILEAPVTEEGASKDGSLHVAVN